MPDSPLLNSSDLVNLALSSDGTRVDPSVGIASVTINNTINRIPYARIELLDGDMPEGKFPLSDSNDFDPGKKIKIEAGYGQKLDTLFEGIVVKHSLKIGGDNDARLILECRHEAVKLTVGRKNACFVDSKDSDIIAGILTDNGLDKDVEATSLQHKKLLQYYCSDWDFLLARAEVNGLLVSCEASKVSVKAPDTSSDAVLELSYGNDLIELHADLDARSQFARVESAGWDPANQQVVTGEAPPSQLNDQGDIDSKKLAQVMGLDSFRLQTQANKDPAMLKSWAEAQQVKSGLARIRGRMKFQGSASAVPGSLIELAGVGDHFNGKVFVGAVTHLIGRGNWYTEASLGLAPEWFAEQRDLVAPPASGLLPGVDGLQIGSVLQVDEDPDNAYRIKINLPLMSSAEDVAVWARSASFYASEEFGAFFLPEVGDEVIVGFLNGDPTDPVVLGSLYSASRKAPYEADNGNTFKAILTRSKLKLEFDDDKKVITLETPEGNNMVFSEDAKSIVIQDQNQNKVELDQDGISLDSPGDISIKAQGKIDIEASGAISVESQTGDVSARGMNVNLEAQTGLTAKGNASAELSASGQTTVKGAMVMIN